jgi:hypothetical protein
MQIWNTLSVSDIGTYKIRFSFELEKEEAEELGKSYCMDNILQYVGTYGDDSIDYEETVCRKIFMENNKKGVLTL